jgi:hypothetical protein
MPNWVEQELDVVGQKPDVDRFVREGLKQRGRGEPDDLFNFAKLCPPKTEEHSTGVVLSYFRTRTQAHFSIITSWDYPAEFYARLPKQWPSLSFVCAVNEDMGQFGGIVIVHDGQANNLVRDYDTNYSRRSHRRVIHSALTRWGHFLVEGRPWRVALTAAWEHKSMPFDAHFDGDFWFYFRTREELIRFKTKYKSKTKWAMRRRVDNWMRVRLR